MNLMDMLSTDASVYQSSVDSFYNEVEPTQPPSSNKPTTYYFPTKFSCLQTDLSEAVVQMFASSLRDRLAAHNQRTSISNLLEPSKSMINGHVKGHSQDANAACSLMFNTLSTISMHPSLLVDHFIPKGLLLSSTKASLSSQSGKLLLADRLINMISEKFDMSPPEKDFNLLLVAKSIKELEFVEGLVIGKKLRYQNVSTGKSLYEEDPTRMSKDEVFEDEMGHDVLQRHWRNTRRKKQSHDAELSLKLITSSHLCSTYSSDIQFDLIISFDSELETSAPSLDLLRSKSMSYIVPIIMPIAVFSIEHFKTLVPKTDVDFGGLSSEEETEWQLQVLSVFVANRQKLFEGSKETSGDFYAENESDITDWLMNWQSRDPPACLKTLDDFSKEVVFQPSREDLNEKLSSNYLESLGRILKTKDDDWQHITPQTFENGGVIDYASSRGNLAKFVALRKNQVEYLIQKGTREILPPMREEEAKKQEDIDQDEDRIGEYYRKLRKLNEEVAIADRKFNRVETEHHKHTEQTNELLAKKRHLEETLKQDNMDFTQMAEEQLATIKQLEEERDILQKEKEALGKESDTVREDYQTKSTKAVMLTNDLQKAKAKAAKLKDKLEGPGMQLLPALAKRDELAAYESQLNRILQEDYFDKQLFSSQYEKIIKERSALLDSSVQSGSTSRTNNRISRASTPF